MSEDIYTGIVRILSGRSVGTGFAVSDDGLLVTCKSLTTHVEHFRSALKFILLPGIP